LQRREAAAVLVVDDEEMIRDLTRDILERYGYTVMTAAGGAEAVGIYRQRGSLIAVVVLDILMPGMGGREAFRRIREIDPAARIIVSSGHDQERDAIDLIREGAVAFVQKPYRITEFVRKVGEIMEKDGRESADDGQRSIDERQRDEGT
jgi:two-component system, cell cycle sensor histidine kinase and response regulator CckA